MRNLEITVKVNCNYEELNDYLLNNGFKIMEKYTCYDRYMINKNIDITNMDDLDVISKCVLVRDIGSKKALTYKIKEYDDNGNIIKQEKIDCLINDIDTAIKFMKSIDYKVLFEIYDKLTVYSNGFIEFATQNIDDKYLFIEMEDTSLYTPKHDYNNIEDMISDFDKLGIRYDKSNYFVSKAKMKLKEVKKCL